MFGKKSRENQYTKGKKLSERKLNVSKTIAKKEKILLNAFTNVKKLKVESKSSVHYLFLSNSEQVEYYKNYEQKIFESIFQGLSNVREKFGIATLDEAKLFFIETATEIETERIKEYEKKETGERWFGIFTEEWNHIGIDPWKIQKEAKMVYSTIFSQIEECLQDLKVKSRIIEKGYCGEQVVKQNLELLFGGQAMIYYNRQIEFSGKSTEIDAIVISKHGIFLLEIKNMGDEYSKYKLIIAPDGQFLYKYPNGKTIPYHDRNVAYQMQLHYSVFTQMTADISQSIYPYVDSVLVFSNDDIQIENESSLQIVRANTMFQYFYDKIKQNKKLSEDQLKSINKAIETNSAQAKKHQILDVYTTLQDLIRWGMQILLEYQKIVYCLKDTYYWCDQREESDS